MNPGPGTDQDPQDEEPGTEGYTELQTALAREMALVEPGRVAGSLRRSRTSRTLVASATGVNGFWMKVDSIGCAPTGWRQLAGCISPSIVGMSSDTVG